MPYLTPDFVALREEAKRYAVHHPLPLAPSFIGRRFPLLSAQPLPPYQPKLMITKPVTGAKAPRGATTWSPLERDYVDPPGPGLFLHGLGEWTVPARYVGAAAVLGAAWWILRKR